MNEFGDGCVMCDRPVEPLRVTCSDICLDLWVGDLGRVR